jgi:hypothetical protein
LFRRAADPSGHSEHISQGVNHQSDRARLGLGTRQMAQAKLIPQAFRPIIGRQIVSHFMELWA